MKKNGQENTPEAADQLTEFHEMRSRDDFFLAIAEKTILLGEKDMRGEALAEQEPRATLVGVVLAEAGSDVITIEAEVEI